MSEPAITRPLLKNDTPAAGFYILNGESVLQFIPTQEKEQIYDCFEKIREQNPGERILLVLDNFSSHICSYTRQGAHELELILSFFQRIAESQSY